MFWNPIFEELPQGQEVEPQNTSKNLNHLFPISDHPELDEFKINHDLITHSQAQRIRFWSPTREKLPPDKEKPKPFVAYSHLPYQPQINGRAELVNHIFEKTVDPDRKDWAYRTAYKTQLGMSPHQFCYGKDCRLPVEIEHQAP